MGAIIPFSTFNQGITIGTGATNPYTAIELTEPQNGTPFRITIGGGLFSPHYDSVMYIGYNIGQGASRIKTGANDAMMGLAFESNYWDGSRLNLEFNLEVRDTSDRFFRPMGLVMDKTNPASLMAWGFRTAGGAFSVLDSTGTVTYFSAQNGSIATGGNFVMQKGSGLSYIQVTGSGTGLGIDTAGQTRMGLLATLDGIYVGQGFDTPLARDSAGILAGSFKFNKSILAVGNAQNMVAASTINATYPRARIQAAAPCTLTSTPTIADGVDGQTLLIMNIGATNITLQDQGTLANSNLRLTANTVVLAPRQNLELTFSSDVNDWVQTKNLVTVL